MTAPRANTPLAVLEPGLSAQKLEALLKTVKPGLFAWTPKIHKKVVMDEIFKVLPRLDNYHKHIPIDDERFPTLRHVLQTSKQDFNGMYKFGDIIVYSNPHEIQKLEKIVDPKSPLIILLNDDLKEITLSQHNIINTGNLVGHRAGINEEDIVCTTLDLHHSFGLSLGIGMALSHKVKLVWVSEEFDAEKILESLFPEYCTVLMAQPHNFAALLELIKKPVKHHLKKVIVVSSPDNIPSVDLLKSIEEKLRVKAFVTFGTNETGGVIAMTYPDTVFKPNLVGKPLPHTELKIVNEKGVAVPINYEGQLLVKGFNIMNGYRNDPELTKQKIKNGYLQTGITSKLDSDKNLIICKFH